MHFPGKHLTREKGLSNLYYLLVSDNEEIIEIKGSKDGTVVRALASNQCPQVRVQDSLGIRVFPSPQKPTFLNSSMIWKMSRIALCSIFINLKMLREQHAHAGFQSSVKCQLSFVIDFCLPCQVILPP